MNVLLVDSDQLAADFLRRGLRGEGWTVEHVETGEEALVEVLPLAHDAIVLEVVLPDQSGLQVCRVLRARRVDTPIMLLSALGTVDEIAAGLRAGADDYVVRPFRFDELIARLEALVRRARRFENPPNQDVVEAGGVRLDRGALVVTVGDRPVPVTARERAILAMLLANAGRALARERILNAVADGQRDPLTNAIDVHVAHLRRKLGAAGVRIETVRGIGYRFAL